jgi:23S rRNA pseudouridine1911/1915/1917 synthase
MKFKYIVDEQNSRKTIYSILKEQFDFSDKLINKIKRRDMVWRNKVPVFVSSTVKTGDVVEADIGFEETSENVKPVKMDLDILYEDEAVIALNKPADMVVNPIGAHWDNTIANGLMHYFQSKGCFIKIRPVSRLDKDTTGVIVFAKNGHVHDKLERQMRANRYHKEYVGIVHGRPEKPAGTIDLPIARSPGSIILREISEAGAPCVTHYTVVESLHDASALNFILETGRTHQIRVHCKAIGHPLIGDTLYSDVPTTLINRQALHSHLVRFAHPISGNPVEITAPLPDDMKRLKGLLT